MARPTLTTPEMQDDDPDVAAYYKNEGAAARLSPTEQSRTMLDVARMGYLATITSSKSTEGFPNNSVIQFIADDKGHPIFAISDISAHTKDLRADPRASFLVQSIPFDDLDNARITLTGRCAKVEGDEVAAVREAYLKRFPNAFWIDFGDFSFWRMDELVKLQYNGGFGKAAKLKVAEFEWCAPDPVAQFSAPVVNHMNQDHGSSIVDIVSKYVGVSPDTAAMVNLDALGMAVACTKGDWQFTTRVSWPEPLSSRKDIKDAIVTMSRAAAAEKAQAEEPQAE